MPSFYISNSNSQKTLLPHEKFNCISSEHTPMFAISFSKEQCEQFFIKNERILFQQFDQKMRTQIGQFLPANVARKKVIALEKQFQTFRQQIIERENLSKLYDSIVEFMEFCAIELSYRDQKHTKSLFERTSTHNLQYKNSATLKALYENFFEALFDFPIQIELVNLAQLKIGFEQDTVHLLSVFNYDVLYHYPPMFKTDDLPCFFINITKFLKKDTSRGKTKTATVDFAFSRIIKALQFAPYQNEPFLFSSQFETILTTRPAALPVVTERKRYMIYQVESLHYLHPKQHVSYVEGRYQKEIFTTQRTNTVTIPFYPYVAYTYANVANGDVDWQHVPIDAQFIENPFTFIDQIDATYKPFVRQLAIHLFTLEKGWKKNE